MRSQKTDFLEKFDELRKVEGGRSMNTSMRRKRMREGGRGKEKEEYEKWQWQLLRRLLILHLLLLLHVEEEISLGFEKSSNKDTHPHTSSSHIFHSYVSVEKRCVWDLWTCAEHRTQNCSSLQKLAKNGKRGMQYV